MDNNNGNDNNVTSGAQGTGKASIGGKRDRPLAAKGVEGSRAGGNKHSKGNARQSKKGQPINSNSKIDFVRDFMFSLAQAKKTNATAHERRQMESAGDKLERKRQINRDFALRKRIREKSTLSDLAATKNALEKGNKAFRHENDRIAELVRHAGKLESIRAMRNEKYPGTIEELQKELQEVEMAKQLLMNAAHSSASNFSAHGQGESTMRIANAPSSTARLEKAKKPAAHLSSHTPPPNGMHAPRQETVENTSQSRATIFAPPQPSIPGGGEIGQQLLTLLSGSTTPQHLFSTIGSKNAQIGRQYPPVPSFNQDSRIEARDGYLSQNQTGRDNGNAMGTIQGLAGLLSALPQSLAHQPASQNSSQECQAALFQLLAQQQQQAMPQGPLVPVGPPDNPIASTSQGKDTPIDTRQQATLHGPSNTSINIAAIRNLAFLSAQNMFAPRPEQDTVNRVLALKNAPSNGLPGNALATQLLSSLQQSMSTNVMRTRPETVQHPSMNLANALLNASSQYGTHPPAQSGTHPPAQHPPAQSGTHPPAQNGTHPPAQNGTHPPGQNGSTVPQMPQDGPSDAMRQLLAQLAPHLASQRNRPE